MSGLLPTAKQQFFGNNGLPLTGGLLYTYAAGTTTPAPTWSDSNLTTLNTNPIVLNARGEATIFGDRTYKVSLHDSLDSTIWTVDGVGEFSQQYRTSATGSAKIPAGTTAQRDTSPLAGYFRFNLTLGQYEGYDGATWSQFLDLLDVLTQSANRGTTAGSSTAYTLSISSAVTAYVAGLTMFVTFHAACGAAPTLQINGIATPPNLVKQLADGSFANMSSADIPIGYVSRVTLVSPTQALVEKFVAVTSGPTFLYEYRTLK